MMVGEPAIFMSYAHEDAGLARSFASALEEAGARVWLDQGELLIGDSLIDRISQAIADFDFVAALVSPASVGSNWCQKEIALAMSKQLRRGGGQVTVLPLRVGEVVMPPSLADTKWLQLDVNALAACATHVVHDARRHLAGSARVGTGSADLSGPERRDLEPVANSETPVRIVGVDTDHIGRPRGDGTRGSALYRVPLILNRVPHPLWAAAFPEAWNRPPAWTTMHRPGIATVNGDRIVLDGTTLEEVESYHLQTLKLVVRQLNERMDEYFAAAKARREAEVQAAEEHERRVREVADRLRFDAD